MILAMAATAAVAQTYDVDLTVQQPRYGDARPDGEAQTCGWDVTATPGAKSTAPRYFSFKVPDGNYKVTVTLGSKRQKGSTVVRAESRRLLLEETATRKGETKTVTFTVNKRSTYIDGKKSVKIKEREKDYLNWDNRLTLEFNGTAPAVSRITVEPAADSVTTLFLCGNSTVVDQNNEPWASWGQMIPRWFDQRVAISNHAESGLTAGSFLASNRLDKVLAMMRKGDWVVCEFGHNDQKERGAGSGAWYNFAHNLKIFVDKVRAQGGNIIFITPTQRRNFDDNGKISETHGDYPDAMREVARRENVPVIELHDMTRTFFETLGVENSKRALVHYPAGTFPGQSKDFADNTHFNPYGAYEVAKMVVMGMKQINVPFISCLRTDWQDYNAAQPDDFTTFKWHNAPFYDNVKPDGQ